MNPFELVWLAEAAARHHTIVEIGSYAGRSTRALADNTPGKVYALDDWLGPREDYIPEATRENIKQVCEDNGVYKIFCNNLEDHIASGKVVPIKCDHRKLPNLSLQPDMVFIDGGHTYEDIRSDILTWYHRILPGGIICGHDVQMSEVCRAVLENFPTAQVAAATTIWFVKL